MTNATRHTGNLGESQHGKSRALITSGHASALWLRACLTVRATALQRRSWPSPPAGARALGINAGRKAAAAAAARLELVPAVELRDVAGGVTCRAVKTRSKRCEPRCITGFVAQVFVAAAVQEVRAHFDVAESEAMGDNGRRRRRETMGGGGGG